MRVKASDAAAALAAQSDGVVKQRLTSGGAYEVWLVRDCSVRTTHLQLGPLPDGFAPRLPESGDVLAVDIDEKANGGLLRVTLLTDAYVDVFAVLVDDLVDAADHATNPDEGAQALLIRLQRWEGLFLASQNGLSLSAQRGLLGELHVLKAVAAEVGLASAVATWTGPEGGTRDFELGDAGIEVKTTAGKGALSVRISSERQLELVAVSRLFLWCNSIERSERGSSLAEVVDAIIEDLGVGTAAMSQFTLRLARAGYLQPDRHRYGTKYLVRETFCYRVDDQFPALRTSDLPNGISDISYLVSLAACSDWSLPSEVAVAEFSHAR